MKKLYLYTFALLLTFTFPLVVMSILTVKPIDFVMIRQVVTLVTVGWFGAFLTSLFLNDREPVTDYAGE